MPFTNSHDGLDDQSRINLHNAARVFSKEELEYLRGLPVRKVKYAGQQISALYDDAERKLFILDSHGIPTGEVKVLNKPLSEITPTKKGPESPPSAPGKKRFRFFGKNRQAPDAEEGEQAGDESPTPKKKNKGAVIALVAIMIIGLIFAVKPIIRLISPGEAEPQPATADTTHISVIQAVQNILPDTVLTPAMFQEVSITTADFNDVILKSGRTVYQWDQMAFIDGMESCQFIPSGTYLYTDSVQHLFYYDDNPYRVNNDPEFGFLSIPANISYSALQKVFIGEIVDIEISKDTHSGKKQTLQTEVVEGLDHSSAITSSVTTDVYRFDDIVVVDLINSNGDSLYDVLTRYNSVPDGNLQSVITEELQPRYDSNAEIGNEDINEIFPEFYVTSVVILVPQEHIKAIGKLSSDTTSLSISNVGSNMDADTKEKKSFVEESLFTCQILCEVLDSF